jgi:aldehyde dehydrogenase
MQARPPSSMSTRASTRRIDVFDPADSSEVVGSVPRCSADDADRVIRAAHDAFPEWSRRPITERATLLGEAARAVLAGLEDRAVTLVRESGKVISEARNEQRAATRTLEYYASVAETFPLTEELPSVNGQVVVAREPMGVASVIVPWNAPILLALLGVAPALAAGNTVVVKPSSEAPLALTDFLDVVAQRLPDGVLSVVTGSGAEVGDVLVTHPLVRRVMFTGSTEVGRDVAAAAMATLKRATMELGGNDPALVLHDADLDGDIVPEILKSVYATSGQVCYSVKRIYVHESLHDDFVERFTAASDSLAVGNGLDPRTDLGPVINRSQLERVEGLVAEARTRGARVASVGQMLDPAALGRGWFHLPTVITEVDHSFGVVSCEQFGPVIPIMPFRTEDEAVALANDTEFGLASSIWTTDEDRAFELARRIEAGTTFVNVHRPGASGVDMPFGGFKQSGIGRGHGVVALEEQFELHTLSSRRP